MAKKYETQFNVRRIGNGFILTGHIAANGGHKKLEETYFPDMPSLDVGLTAILSTAEQVAASIKNAAPTITFSGLLGNSWLSSLEEDDEDEEDEGDDD